MANLTLRTLTDKHLALLDKHGKRYRTKTYAGTIARMIEAHDRQAERIEILEETLSKYQAEARELSNAEQGRAEAEQRRAASLKRIRAISTSDGARAYQYRIE